MHITLGVLHLSASASLSLSSPGSSLPSPTALSGLLKSIPIDFSALSEVESKEGTKEIKTTGELLK